MAEIDVSNLVAAVERSVGLGASAATFIRQTAAIIAAAVADALEKDDAADQGTKDAVTAAINAEVARLTAASDDLAAALASNPT